MLPYHINNLLVEENVLHGMIKHQMIHSFRSTDFFPLHISPFQKQHLPGNSHIQHHREYSPLLTMATECMHRHPYGTASTSGRKHHSNPGDGLCPHVYRIARMVITPSIRIAKSIFTVIYGKVYDILLQVFIT